MVEVIFGAMVACSNGYTTASTETTCEMDARCAGVVSTETTGSFSFSALLQPLATQSIAAMVLKRAIHLRRNVKVVFIVVGFMESSESPSGFANSPGPRDSAGLRLDTPRWLARTWFARPLLRGP